MKHKPTATRSEIAKAKTEQEIIALGFSWAYARRLINIRLTKKRGY